MSSSNCGSYLHVQVWLQSHSTSTGNATLILYAEIKHLYIYSLVKLQELKSRSAGMSWTSHHKTVFNSTTVVAEQQLQRRRGPRSPRKGLPSPTSGNPGLRPLIRLDGDLGSRTCCRRRSWRRCPSGSRWESWPRRSGPVARWSYHVGAHFGELDSY